MTDRRIQPRKLVARGAHWQGELAVAALPRLLALCADREAMRERTVAYVLDFGDNAAGRAAVIGSADVRMNLECQRCLQAFDHDVHARVALELVDADTDAPVQPDHEPLVVDAEYSLAELLETELLLALPFAPMHGADGCHLDGQYRAEAEDHQEPRRQPFASLREVLNEQS